jgi:ribonuclease HI
LSAPERLVVNFDGGSRGNPGPAAIAAVAIDGADTVLLERGETIGVATNNVAEYRALLLAVELVKELGASQAEFIGDSKLIVEQVKGNWKVKDLNLRPLRAQAVEALAGLDGWSIRNVPREQNIAADALVNATLDAA